MSDIMSEANGEKPPRSRGPAPDSYHVVIGKLQAARQILVRNQQAAAAHKREVETKNAAIAERDAIIERLRAQFVIASGSVALKGLGHSLNSTSRRGALAELLACAWLVAQGYEVFRAVHADGFADVAAYKDGGFLLIDVKTVSRYHHKPHHTLLSQRQIKAGVRLLTVIPETGECCLHPPRVEHVS